MKEGVLYFFLDEGVGWGWLRKEWGCSEVRVWGCCKGLGSGYSWLVEWGEDCEEMGRTGLVSACF